MSDFTSDIEIEIVTERLSDHFLMSPNDLHRGQGPWQGLTPGARCLLAALLTYSSGWKLRRDDVDEIMAPLGRRAVDTILRELQGAGFISRVRGNADGGRFVWQWKVRLKPNPEQADKTISAGRTIRTLPIDGESVDGERVDGGDQGKDSVSAGRTIRTLPIDGEPASNRSTTSLEEPREETTSSSSTQDVDGDANEEPRREDVETICRHLADRIEGNGSKRPRITKTWRAAGRRLLDRDGRTVEQVLRAIDWCQDDEFWRSNIMSMPTLRERYDQLRLQAQRDRSRTVGASRPSTTDQRVADGLQVVAQLREMEQQLTDIPNPFLAIGGGQS